MKARDQEVSNRIALLRFSLVFAIVFVHVPSPDIEEAVDSQIFHFLRTFLADGACRASVPLLSCISGFLLFRSQLDRRVRSLFVRKARSLFLPMVLWNLAWVLTLYVLQSNDRWTPRCFQAYPFDAESWTHAVFGFGRLPAIPSLFFLRDLFVVSLLSPLLGVALRRRPWLGLVLVLVIFGANWDALLVFRGDIAINFYIGGMVAVLGLDLRRLDRQAISLFALFLVLCAYVANLGFIPLWFRVLSPWLIWPLSALCLRSPIGARLIGLSKYSFFLFLSHQVILLILFRLYWPFSADPGLYPAYWFLKPLAATVLACGIYEFLARYFPRLLYVSLGFRQPETAHDARTPAGNSAPGCNEAAGSAGASRQHRHPPLPTRRGT